MMGENIKSASFTTPLTNAEKQKAFYYKKTSRKKISSMSSNNNNNNLNPLLDEDDHTATTTIGPQPHHHQHGGVRTPPQRSTTDPYEANSRDGYLLGNTPQSMTHSRNQTGGRTNTNNASNGRNTAFPPSPAKNNNNPTSIIAAPANDDDEENSNNNLSLPPVIASNNTNQLDNKQIAELLRQQDPSFVRLVVPSTSATPQDVSNVSQVRNIPFPSNVPANDEDAAAIVYENPEQPQPTAEELKQQRRVERISRHYGEEARDRGQQVPLIKPRYGPWRRNKESIRVSTNLTLGQQHNNASELLSSGGSFGMRPEKMVVQCGIQHYVDELHFDTPYAMFRTKDGKIETRSVGWSKRGDFVVERHDLVLTSDYCYSSSDALTQSDTEYFGKKKKVYGSNSQKPKRLGENVDDHEGDKTNNDDNRAKYYSENNTSDTNNNDNNTKNVVPSTTGNQPILLRRKPVLQVAHSRFDAPLCMDPAAPKPREVVSEGELRQASRNLWRRKYPGVKCPKNRKVRNRLMNDYFVNEHTRPMQLFHAQNQSNKKKETSGGQNGNDSEDDDSDDSDDDMMLDDFQYQMANHSARSKKNSSGGQQFKRRKLLSFTPKHLPVGFADFADKTERQQQAILEKLGMAENSSTTSNGGFAFSSSGGLQDKSSQQNQGKRPDMDSTEGRWNRLPQKHKQEISHALTNTEFMPGFVRDVEQQIRQFLSSWHEYHDLKKHQGGGSEANNNMKKPEPHFDVLCRDGYGRLMVHILAQFYLLTSQSHDRPKTTTTGNHQDDDGNDSSPTSPPSSPNTPTQPQQSSTSSKTNNNNTRIGLVSNKANKAKNFQNNNSEVQRVTRVMVSSQKQRPPPLPTNTLASLFLLNDTPSLTPQQGPSSTGISPISPGENQSFSIGAAALSSSSNNNVKTTSTIITKKKTKTTSTSSMTTTPQLGATTVAATTTQSPAFTVSSTYTNPPSNRFGSLANNNTKRNENDDSSSNNDEDEGNQSSNLNNNKRRFKKKKTAPLRRKILPLLQ